VFCLLPFFPFYTKISFLLHVVSRPLSNFSCKTTLRSPKGTSRKDEQHNTNMAHSSNYDLVYEFNFMGAKNINSNMTRFPCHRVLNFSVLSASRSLYRMSLYRVPEKGTLIVQKARIRRDVQCQPLLSGTRQRNILCEPED